MYAAESSRRMDQIHPKSLAKNESRTRENSQLALVGNLCCKVDGSGRKLFAIIEAKSVLVRTTMVQSDTENMDNPC